MKKYIFKDHCDSNITKEVKGFYYNMLPSGSYEVFAGCFNKVIVDHKNWYLAGVEELQ